MEPPKGKRKKEVYRQRQRKKSVMIEKFGCRNKMQKKAVINTALCVKGESLLNHATS
tara:strand:+ start:363 stop:533 length:171 start_codon:yes stop_codon:yes gene_type:complete